MLVDGLSNCQKLMPDIYNEFRGFFKKYSKSWLRKFINDIKTNFDDEGSVGIDLIASQRPGVAFTDMNEGQFRHYVLGVFQEFIDEVSTVVE